MVPGSHSCEVTSVEVGSITETEPSSLAVVTTTQCASEVSVPALACAMTKPVCSALRS